VVEGEKMGRGGRDGYVLTERTEQRYGGGTLHSNLDDAQGFEVVDRMTGDTLGGVAEVDTRKLGLAGSSRQIAGRSEGRILTDKVTGAEPAKFRPRGKPITSMALARATVEALNVPEDALLLFPTGGALRLLHGLGSVGGRLLIRLLQGMGVDHDAKPLTPFGLDVAGLKPGPLTVPDGLAETCLKADFKALEKTVGPGPWASSTPEPWRMKRSGRRAASRPSPRSWRAPE